MVVDSTYQVRGYAYAGGGRRVTRVEISSDDGETWNLANITYPEDCFRAISHSDKVYGDLDLTNSDTCFCWCFWSFEMPISTIKTTCAIMVRCMDESLALQPRDMYWNATGMMNNWYVSQPADSMDLNRGDSSEGGSECVSTTSMTERFVSSIPQVSFSLSLRHDAFNHRQKWLAHIRVVGCRG